MASHFVSTPICLTSMSTSQSRRIAADTRGAIACDASLELVAVPSQ
jgi:hypothetical protein